IGQAVVQGRPSRVNPVGTISVGCVPPPEKPAVSCPPGPITADHTIGVIVPPVASRTSWPLNAGPVPTVDGSVNRIVQPLVAVADVLTMVALAWKFVPYVIS